MRWIFRRAALPLQNDNSGFDKKHAKERFPWNNAMPDDNLELRVQECGRELFSLIKDERPSLYDTEWWTGKVLEWAMRNEEFKVELFRFVDVLPNLPNEESLARHLEEYFGRGGD